MLKLTLKQNRRHNELPEDLHRRLNSKVTMLSDLFCWEPLDQVVQKLYFGWLGHISRHPALPYARILAWRGVQWHAAKRVSQERFGYARAGRPLPYIEDYISSLLGPFYAGLAQDRAEWQDIRTALTGADPGLTHYSNRIRDVLQCTSLRRGRDPLRFIHFADSLDVVNITNGSYKAKNADSLTYAASLRWSGHIIKDILRCMPWELDGKILRHFSHCRREFNTAADFIANKVLDENRDFYVLAPCSGPFNLVLWSDGASRGNPGPASAAAILCIVQSHSASISDCSAPVIGNSLLNGELSVFRVVACTGRRLGIATNTVAEWEAACLARRLLFDWLRFVQYV
jgi:ribonuclease HI